MGTKQAVEAMLALYQAIAAAGAAGIPSGHLYAFAMNSFADVGSYESCIGLLVRSRLVTRKGDLLIAEVLSDA